MTAHPITIHIGGEDFRNGAWCFNGTFDEVDAAVDWATAKRASRKMDDSPIFVTDTRSGERWRVEPDGRRVGL